MLSLYDLRGRINQPSRANEQRISGLVSLRAHIRDGLYDTAPVRIVHSDLQIDENAFDGLGDVYLFGAVLDRFLAKYVAANTFSQLTISSPRWDTTEQLDYPARAGAELVL